MQNRSTFSQKTCSNHGFSFARSELIEKEAVRLQAELTEARQEERMKMLEQLLQLKKSADERLTDQRDQYELRLKALSEKNDIFSQVVNLYILILIHAFSI